MDDEDLDELLDEVEKKFCRNVSIASSAARTNSNVIGKDEKDKDGQKKHGLCILFMQDFDFLALSVCLDTICTVCSASRCCPVFIGGSSVANGVGTAASKRSCDQLRCISCDFRVLMFDDCEWDSTCDYLFLRAYSVGDVVASICTCTWCDCIVLLLAGDFLFSS
uniref:Cilia- and flagella-associated protein 418 n=1 Tax=Neolamprologus brichardi TaxID=32507 RepID=A0A3Q4H1N2_NEOBR